jgi:hypothetical protein
VSFYGFCTHGSGKTGCAALMAAASFYGAQRNKRYSVQQENGCPQINYQMSIAFFCLNHHLQHIPHFLGICSSKLNCPAPFSHSPPSKQ